MNSRAIRFGYVSEESKDAGPFKLVKVVADGKEMDVLVHDVGGVSASPLKGSHVTILTADDDDGKAVGLIGGVPTKDRVDGLKPGEVDLRNHKRGQSIKFDDDGHLTITNKAGTITKHFADGTVGVQPGSGKKVYLGKVDGVGCHRVATEGGYSSNVYAKV